MRTRDFVKGREWEILGHYGFEENGNKHIDCPLCEGKKNFRFNIHEGVIKWICNCGRGDWWSFLTQFLNISWQKLASDIDRIFGNVADYVPKPKKKEYDYSLLKPIKGTPVIDYLNSRGITKMPDKAVMYSLSEYDCETNQSYCAMIGIATDERLDVKKRHRTFLNGHKKVNTQKKQKTISEGGENLAIKMFDLDVCLGIAEGIETALSTTQKYNIPTWSAMSASGMDKFRAPRGVKTLFVFADNDIRSCTGLAAAFNCAKGNMLSNNDVGRVVVRWPELADFNDVLNNPFDEKIYEWEAKK